MNPRDIIFGPRDVPVDDEKIESIVNHILSQREKNMSKTMRAKLTVQSVTDDGYGNTVKFSAQYSQTPEDNSYSKATPSASLEMRIDNPALVGTIKPKQKFYVDFTPCE